MKGEETSGILTTSGIFLAVCLFILYLLMNTEYVIDADKLYVKSGFIYRKHLNISRITSVKKTKSLFSAPAASLDRIQLTYDKFGILVLSPKDKENFVKNLVEINPNIKDYVNL
ncbi:PH domain-containing protein [Maribacter litopenaei]|uniref:PH domain-containing protein n=1 Tax=Maribacter litopenaei TaxID=2976127 RepID=A0ABY5Y7F4_9FLAO|nr:PH domain-containing protein [Maribacter litopenaei]UWX54958.1 PH domain-containing protein [Maribacter litopenaei]